MEWPHSCVFEQGSQLREGNACIIQPKHYVVVRVVGDARLQLKVRQHHCSVVRVRGQRQRSQGSVSSLGCDKVSIDRKDPPGCGRVGDHVAQRVDGEQRDFHCLLCRVPAGVTSCVWSFRDNHWLRHDVGVHESALVRLEGCLVVEQQRAR